MSDVEFSVHLGGGLYMNSQGVLSHGPEPGKPAYQTPGGGLPIQPDALAKAFQGMAKALPDKDDPKSREKFDKILDGIGMAAADKENLIGMLQSIGAVASVIGSVVPIVGAALAVLTLLLGSFRNGPSALELLIHRRFDELVRQIKALEIQSQQRDLRNQRNAISTALAAIANYVVELKNTPPDEATLLQRQQDVRNQIKDAGTAVIHLLSTSTWQASFDRNEYQRVWPWIAHRLFTFPVIGGSQPAVYPPQSTNHFDHRLMVPLAMFAVTGYLTVLRAAAPEFRSTRQYREDLWEFAVNLEILAENMRQVGLARTVYTAADFGSTTGGIPWGLTSEEVVDLSAFGLAPYLAPGNTRFAVGALDLWAHHDGYFTPQFSAGYIQIPGPQNAKQGLLDVRWIPPARLERYDQIVPSLGWEPANQPPATQRRYRIANPDECAKAANAVAEQNYVDLLYSSGYFNLIHLVATLRNESTDPDHSQTVRSDAWLRRKPGSAVGVTVESQPILMTGVISAAAERQPQEYKATTWFTTQPLGREVKLTYKVWLRTLGANFSLGGSSYSEQRYTDYHQVGYTDDLERKRPGFKKLFTSTGVPLSQLQIAEGRSTAEPREFPPRTAVLQAITFDWWVPVAPLGHTEISSEAILKQASLRGSGFEAGGGSAGAPKPPWGGSAPSPPPLAIGATLELGGIDTGVQFSDLVGWEDGTEPINGQHRVAALGEVRLDYTVKWQADRLTVSLKNNRPTDRNYVVYVVVEEKLGSGEVLHTVERIPITGQLTFVPQSFFDQEFEALAKTARLFRDFTARYAKSLRDIPRRPGGPGDPDPDVWQIGGLLGLDHKIVADDPVLRELQLGSFSAPQDFERFVTLALHHPPASRVLRQLLTDSRLSETTLLTMLESLRIAQSATGPTESAMEEECGD